MVALDGLSDSVTLTKSSERSVTCPGVPAEENLARRALDRLEERVGQALPCHVEIVKRIPAQAGLGGGSSDAATTLVLADELFGLGLPADALEDVAAEVGSDVPFFIRGGAQWASGRGEVLRPAAAPPFVALVAFPGFGLSTADVYRLFDELPAPPGAPDPTTDTLDTILRNDLWPAARRCRPELDELDEALRGAGASHTLLCGSGAAMAGFFADAASAERARDEVPGAVAVVRGGSSR